MMKEALEIVERLNLDSWVEDGRLDYTPFEFHSDGYQSAILFMGVVLWNTESDDRDYIGDTDEQEPLMDYIIRESLVVFEDLSVRMLSFKRKTL